MVMISSLHGKPGVRRPLHETCLIWAWPGGFCPLRVRPTSASSGPVREEGILDAETSCLVAFEAGTGSVGLFWLAQQKELSRLTALEVGADLFALSDAQSNKAQCRRKKRAPNFSTEAFSFWAWSPECMLSTVICGMKAKSPSIHGAASSCVSSLFWCRHSPGPPGQV